jgi:cyclopropane-fatty-acyl-phospholipid synthase
LPTEAASFFKLIVSQLFILNREDSSDYNTISSLAVSVLSGLSRASNSLSISMTNVSAHYDISNEIFASFLSPDMTYSCPLWTSEYLQTPSESDSVFLQQAQVMKLRRIISEARIKASDHVLEIGTGWGSFAIEAVYQTGCKITSVTLSIEQKEEAEKRIEAAGFTGKIQVLLSDYRNIPRVESGYDKVVSIEMIEHVGRDNLATYFSCISNLLHKTHGIAVFQASTMPDSVGVLLCRL